MTQLTKEHFDSELKTLVTKNEFSGQLKTMDDRLQSMDGQFKSMERRFDSVEAKLGEQTRQLKAHTDTQVESLRQEMQEGFTGVDQKLDALRELLDVRQRVEHLEERVRQLQAQK